MNTTKKITDLQELVSIVENLKKQGKKIVTTSGAFDILHAGHITALEQSKSLGDILIVGLNSDSSIKKYKSDKRPIIPEKERAIMLAALTSVDYVIIFNEPDPINFLELVKPDIHTKGEDHDPEKLLETEVVRQNGGVIIKTKSVKPTTTEIVEKILKIYG